MQPFAVLTNRLQLKLIVSHASLGALSVSTAHDTARIGTKLQVLTLRCVSLTGRMGLDDFDAALF